MARHGNIASDVHRPLYETGQIKEFQDYKNDLLSPATEALQLPSLHFLDGKGESDEGPDTVVMTSFPRSGNTFLRATLERIMGIVTGSDCDISKKLNVALLEMGLPGEGLVDKRVWVVKTHYPERYGKTKFGSERAILLVRSPLDCMTSLFNMVGSGTHDCSIADADFATHFQLWKEFIEQDITVWKDFHDFWLKAKIPVHIIRYEDISQRPQECLPQLFKFILNVESLSGTKVEEYIRLAIELTPAYDYKPRKGLVNGNKDKFSPNMLEHLREHA